MASLVGKTPTGSGPVVVESNPLGRGGEGSVFALVSHSLAGILPAEKLVAKLYHEPLEGDRRAKVSAMILAPPGDEAVAWPLALLLDSSGMFQGYLMKKVEQASNMPWASLAHTGERKAGAPAFDVRYGLTAARNLAVAINAVHLAGHRVGDVNESNIFVGADASVLLVDTDSAQIAGKGKIFPCPVGKPEYTSPELTHGSLRDQERTIESDLFAHAVATFQMITGGAHPTDGVAVGDGDPPSVVEKIRGGVYPSLDEAQAMRPPARIPWRAIPKQLRAALLKALSVDPEARGGLGDFAMELEDVIGHLEQCKKVKQHWFDPRDGACGWCAHAASGQGDPWGPVAPRPAQRALPPIGFTQPGEAAPARRAPAAQARSGGLPTGPGGMAPGAPSSVPGAPPQLPPWMAPLPPHLGVAPKMGGQPAVPGPLPPSPPAPPKAKSPFHWGPKTVLNHPTHGRIMRPAWGPFFKANFRLAFSCLREELPDVLKFWYPKGRRRPEAIAVMAGLLLSLALSVGWLGLVENTPATLPGQVLSALASVAAATGAFTGIALFVFGMASYLKGRVSTAHPAPDEAFGLTLARFLVCGLAYGPFLVIGVLYGVASALLGAVAAELRRR